MISKYNSKNSFANNIFIKDDKKFFTQIVKSIYYCSLNRIKKYHDYLLTFEEEEHLPKLIKYKYIIWFYIYYFHENFKIIIISINSIV